MIILIIAIYIFIAAIELPKLIERKFIKEFIVSLSMLALGLIISIIESIMTVPNPLDPIIFIIRDVLHLNW